MSFVDQASNFRLARYSWATCFLACCGQPFKFACAQWLAGGRDLLYVEGQPRAKDGGDDGDDEAEKKKAASKTKYLCPGCQLKVWAKPDVVIICGKCQAVLLP